MRGVYGVQRVDARGEATAGVAGRRHPHGVGSGPYLGRRLWGGKHAAVAAQVQAARGTTAGAHASQSSAHCPLLVYGFDGNRDMVALTHRVRAKHGLEFNWMPQWLAVSGQLAVSRFPSLVSIGAKGDESTDSNSNELGALASGPLGDEHVPYDALLSTPLPRPRPAPRCRGKPCAQEDGTQPVAAAGVPAKPRPSTFA